MRLLRGAALGSAASLLLFLAALLVLTQTDRGREQVRRLLVHNLNRALDGEVRVARLEGNLLRRLRLVDVSIVDRQRRPFLQADTLATDFRLLPLILRRIQLRDVRLVRTHVVLDEPPGEAWNYERILGLPAEPVEPARVRPWGHWLTLRDVVLVDSRLTVRSTWKPPEDLSPAQRERALREALSPETRENVVRVPGGFQNVMDFRELDARMARLLVAHPDTVGLRASADSLAGVLQPYRPPAVVVRALAGEFRILMDSLFMEDVHAVLSASRVSAEGVYALGTGDLFLRLFGDPIALADLRWLHPPLPEEGGGLLRMELHDRALTTRLVVQETDIRVRDAWVAGRMDLTVGDTVRLRDTDVRFARVDTRLLEEVVPDLDVPRHGFLTGRLAVEGVPRALVVDADVTFADLVAGTSRVLGRGTVGIEDEVRFTNLALRFDPLQAALVRVFEPAFPFRGTILGTATLTGTPADVLRLDSDLVLRDPRGTSRVRAAGGVDLREELRLLQMRVAVDPLQLDVLRADLPELPPAATVAGAVVLDGVPARFLRVDGTLALTEPVSGTSRVTATGGLGTDAPLSFHDLDLRFHPLQAAFVRRYEPAAPLRGTIEGTATLDGVPTALLQVLDSDLVLRDPRGTSRVQAAGGLDLRDELRLLAMRVAVDPFHLDVLRDELPELPPASTLTGEMVLDGVPARFLQVDGELALHEPVSGTSRVAATGGLRTAEPFGFQDLSLLLRPLQVDLLPVLGGPDLQVGGTLEGTAALDGSLAARLEFDADVMHRVAGEVSRLVGDGVLVDGPVRWARIDLDLLPLSLATVGRVVPEAGLMGRVTGTLAAEGSLSALGFRTDLVFHDGAELVGSGTLDLESPQPGYDVALFLRGVDLAAVSTRAPATTDLTGPVTAVGRGVDPATMTASFAADLHGIEVGEVPADEVRLRLDVAAGLAVVDSSVVQLSTARAWLDGSFGIVEGPRGLLAYEVSIDSLHALAPWIPVADTAVVTPRPAVARALEEEARAEYARELRARRVEQIATGQAPPEPPRVEPPPELAGIPRDSLAGAVHVEGWLEGGLPAFDVQGRAELEDVVLHGSWIGEGTAEFVVVGVRAPETRILLDASFQSVLVEGFAYDSLAVMGQYAGVRFGSGWARVTAWQDDATELEVESAFTLAEELGELSLERIRIQGDTVVWVNPRPSVVRWGTVPGVEVVDFELVSDLGGRVFVAGQVPLAEPVDAVVVLEDVEVGPFLTILQLEQEATGRVWLATDLEGTRSSPLIEGDLFWTDLWVDDVEVPDALAGFAYADLELAVDIEVWHEGRLLAGAVASLPVDLSLLAVPGPRLLDQPLLVEAWADSLPLAPIATLTDEVEDVDGFARGGLTIEGTFDAPVIEGAADVDDGAVRVVALGVRFVDAVGRFRLDGDVLVVDSLLAFSRGPVRMTGELDLSRPAAPGFDLVVEARDARVFDTGDGRLDLDADLVIEGPFEQVRVTGEARTRRGMLRIPALAELGPSPVVALDDPGVFERVDTLLLLRRDLLLPPDPLLENVQVDVDVVIDRDVWLRSIEANVEIFTPPEVGPLRLRMNGWDRGIVLEGTVSGDRGDYIFMSRRFRLTRGSLTFTPNRELDGILQVAADHEVRLAGRQPFAIRVVLSGTVRDPLVNMESTAQPPISQTDLLTYVALGEQYAQLLPMRGSVLSGTGAGSGDLVGSLAALATRQLAGAAVGLVATELEAEAARGLGVDVLRITPADYPEELFTDRFIDVLRATEIEIGSYVSPRLFVAGQSRATFSQPGLSVEYLGPLGLRMTGTWLPRFMPLEPTLAEQEPVQRRIFGLLLFRDWRY